MYFWKAFGFGQVFARIRIDLTFDLPIVNKHFPGPDYQNR